MKMLLAIAILTIIALVMIIPRILVQLNINQIKKFKRYPEGFYEKFKKYQILQLIKHVKTLVAVCFLLTLTTFLGTTKFIFSEIEQSKLRGEITTLNDELTDVKEKQKKLINQLPIQPYPKNGIDVTDYDQEALNSDLYKKEIKRYESDLAQKMSAYFGYKLPLIKADFNEKTLHLYVNTYTDDSYWLEQLDNNVESFIDELIQTPFKKVIISKVDKLSDEVIYKSIYERSDENGSFEKELEMVEGNEND